MEKCVLIAEVELAETNHSPCLEGTGHFYGYATELRANLQAVMDDTLLVQLALPSQPREQWLVEPLHETLTGSLLLLQKCLRDVTKLVQLYQQEEASAGQRQTAASQCQCARMKGKSLG